MLYSVFSRKHPPDSETLQFDEDTKRDNFHLFFLKDTFKCKLIFRPLSHLFLLANSLCCPGDSCLSHLRKKSLLEMSFRNKLLLSFFFALSRILFPHIKDKPNEKKSTQARTFIRNKLPKQRLVEWNPTLKDSSSVIETSHRNGLWQLSDCPCKAATK